MNIKLAKKEILYWYRWDWYEWSCNNYAKS